MLLQMDVKLLDANKQISIVCPGAQAGQLQEYKTAPKHPDGCGHGIGAEIVQLKLKSEDVVPIFRVADSSVIDLDRTRELAGQPTSVHKDFPSHSIYSLYDIPIYSEVILEISELQAVAYMCKIHVGSTLRDCLAAHLTSALISKGYTTSRVFVESSPIPRIVVKVGRIVAVNIDSPDPQATSELTLFSKALIGEVLYYPRISRLVQEYKAIRPGSSIYVGTRVIDPMKMESVLDLSVSIPPSRWKGQLEFKNDGGTLTGEMRSSIVLLKEDMLKRNDAFLGYLEVNSDSELEPGLLNTYLSYAIPLGSKVNGIFGVGFSKQQWVEFAPDDPYHDTRLQQFYYSFAIRSPLVVSRSHKIIGEVAVSSTANNAFSPINHFHVLPGVSNSLNGGYLSLGLSAEINKEIFSSEFSIAFKQGLQPLTRSDHLSDLMLYEIVPYLARALTLGFDVELALGPRITLKTQFQGQYAFNRLLPSMELVVGSDTGLLGFPSIVSSSDNGILSTSRVDFKLFTWKGCEFSFSPYFGYATLMSAQNAFGAFREELASAGALFSIASPRWGVEMGWLANLSSDYRFRASPNFSTLIGKGVFVRLQYRF